MQTGTNTFFENNFVECTGFTEPEENIMSVQPLLFANMLVCNNALSEYTEREKKNKSPSGYLYYCRNFDYSKLKFFFDNETYLYKEWRYEA